MTEERKEQLINEHIKKQNEDLNELCKHRDPVSDGEKVSLNTLDWGETERGELEFYGSDSYVIGNSKEEKNVIKILAKGEKGREGRG